jgi:hypothetical protein
LEEADEEGEGAVVCLGDAVVKPLTVVVEVINASVTSCAVLASFGYD